MMKRSETDREVQLVVTLPNIHDVPKEGVNWFAVLGKQNQRRIECLQYFCSSPVRHEFRRWSYSQNVNQKREEYPEEPKRTGLSASRIRIMRFGRTVVVGCLVHTGIVAERAATNRGSMTRTSRKPYLTHLTDLTDLTHLTSVAALRLCVHQALKLFARSVSSC
jgi:hypothetical protein